MDYTIIKFRIQMVASLEPEYSLLLPTARHFTRIRTTWCGSCVVFVALQSLVVDYFGPGSGYSLDGCPTER